MYHPTMAYEIYRLERGLTPSEQREIDRRTGEMAAAIDHALQSFSKAAARALGRKGPGLAASVMVVRQGPPKPVKTN